MKCIRSIILGCIFLLLGCTYAFSLDPLPKEFKPECFQYYDRLESFLIKSGKTYKIDSNKSGFLLVQSGSIVPYKNIDTKDIVYDFIPPYLDLTDNNPQTFLELDTERNTSYTFELGKKTVPQEFRFFYDFDLKYHTFDFFISNDGINYDRVTGENIHDFSFQYFKVEFIPLNKDKKVREAIKIRELSFRSTRKQYVFKAVDDTYLEVYHSYSCRGNPLFSSIINTPLAIDSSTSTLYTTLKPNPKYNTYTLLDRDNDWVEDEIDNCPNHYNPDQKDNNSDGVGNECSDTDGDGIMGYEDICPYTYNPRQYDINTNGIGDACEFDKDKDRVYDSVDNCITVANPGQMDTDNDGIGDICDNCKYYNPSQLDTDDNGIGDVCDAKYLQMKENDKDSDGILDWGDNCKNIENFDQKDTDNDGIGDVCDNCKQVQNKDQTDIDNNGIGDICEDIDNDSYIGYLDNCLYTPNPKQTDSNNNGIGNVCEDVDRDTVIQINDNCPYIYNPFQEDIDKDGLGDVCDGTDNRFVESNKTIFSLLLVLLVVIFGFGIYRMYHRL